MKSRIFVLMSTITVFAVLGIRIRMAAQDQQEQKAAQPHRYTVINLGAANFAFGINNEGWVTGDGELPSDQTEHGFLWRNGVFTDLGTFGGPNSSAPGYQNDKGVIVGSAQTPEKDPFGEFFNDYTCGNNGNILCQGVNPDNISLPFRWQDGKKTALPTLGGNQGQAVSINNRGQVVGVAENDHHDPSCVPPQVLDFEAAIWEPNRLDPQELPPFPGDVAGFALAINDHGHAVGCSGTCGSMGNAAAFQTSCVHATLWRNREEGWSVTDLGSFGGTASLAAAINNRGQVAGGS